MVVVVLVAVVVSETRVAVVALPSGAVVVDVGGLVDEVVEDVVVACWEVEVSPGTALFGGSKVVVVVVAGAPAWPRPLPPEVAAAIENPSTTAARTPDVIRSEIGQFRKNARSRDMEVATSP
jgi:hypothetical protein